MGFRFRKSIGVGPLRVNLSGSGIGASVGVPGFRIGVNARGQGYVHAGSHGLYYRSGLTAPRLPSDPAPNVLSPGSWTHGPIVQHGSVHADVRQDDLTAAIARAVLHVSYLPLAILFLICTLFALAYVVAVAHADVAAAVFVLLSVVAVAGAVFLVVAAWQRDQLVRVELKYDLDASTETQWDHFCRIIASLGSSGVKLLRGGAQVYDPKYHSGAGRLVDTGPLTAWPRYQLPRVLCGVGTPAVEPGGAARYVFLPDRIVCVRGRHLSRLEYADLRFDTGNTSIIEDYAPPGATVIGYTWRFTNKDGGPDRRFNNNYQRPIVEYSLVRMTTDGGMDHAILFVSRPLANSFVQALSGLSSLQTSYSRMAPMPTLTSPVSGYIPVIADQDREDASVREDTNESCETDPFDAAFDALCCVMFADGSCSKEEREMVARVLVRLKAPWTNEQIGERMKRRWIDVKQRGLDAVLAETRHSLQSLRAERQQVLLRKCLQEVAKADGSVGKREKAVYHRLLEALPNAAEQRS